MPVVIIIMFLQTGCGESKTGAFSTTGTVQGNEINISPQISGRITYLCCREGGNVKKDQILAELESEELMASVVASQAALDKAAVNINVAMSAIEAVRAETAGLAAKMESAAAQVDKAVINVTETERELNRAKELKKNRVISTANFDLAETAYKNALAGAEVAKAEKNAAKEAKKAAEAKLKNSQDLLEYARAGYKVAEAELSLARARLAKTLIKSPVDATVIYVAANSGENAAPGVTLMTLVDMTELYIRVDVEESIAANLALHAPAGIRFPGGVSRVLTGRIIEIGQYAEFATQRDVSRGRQDIKTFKVKISADNTDGFLKPGMTALVDFSF